MDPLLPPLPLLHDGDSFLLYLSEVSPKKIRLHTIHRFRNNQNSDGVSENFFDLDPETRKAIVQQINRRFTGRMVEVR